jgi:RHS repeat-associated protein
LWAQPYSFYLPRSLVDALESEADEERTVGVNSGASMSYAYDADNRLASVTDGAGTTNYAYDPVGNLSGVTYPNGVSTSYTYNQLNRLTNMQSTCGTAVPGCGSAGIPIASYTYTLGAGGNRLSVVELSGRTVSYGYDDLYRLTNEAISGASAQNGAIAYQYDPVGNRKQLSSTVAAIPSGLMNYDANDRLGTDVYDNNGNTINNGGIGNVYDFENHLVQHGNVTIVYDGDGNRVSETVAGVTTNYLVADVNPTGYAQVIDEIPNHLPGTGAVSNRSYAYGLERISQRPTANGQKPSFYGYDGHGSVRYLMDPTGAITDTYDYDAFGNLINQTGTTPNNYLFAGEQFDPALGIYYNRARYYDERQGRFWSMDDYEGDQNDPVSLHKYLYAGANPVDRHDPNGNLFEDISIAQAVQYVLIGINILSGITNTYRFVGDAFTAYGAFSAGDMWNGTFALVSAVAHGGLAALSIWGIKGIKAPPPPLSGGLVAVGNAGVASLWRVAATNPAFEQWVWETLWPVTFGVGGLLFASSQGGHQADWELRNSKGQIETRGTEESGGTGKSKPTWPEQLASHTERKILEQLMNSAKPGDISPAMQRFAQEKSVKILYSVEDKVWIYRPDGTVITPD